MEDEKFSPEKSLALIQSMIDKAKNSAADDSFYFLLWGWLVFAASTMQFVLRVILHSPYHYLAWCLMFVGIIVSTAHGYLEHRNKKVRTYIEELLNNLWIGIFLSYVFFGFIFARLGWQNCYPFFMLLYAVGCFVTGRALKFPPLVWGAASSWILAIVSTFTSYETNMLLSALAILLCYIIPGYLLKTRFRKMHAHV